MVTNNLMDIGPLQLYTHKMKHARKRSFVFFLSGMLFVVIYFCLQIKTYNTFHKLTLQACIGNENSIHNVVLRGSIVSEHSVDSAKISIETTSSSTTGGLHACVRFATKYEARQIVSWLHYHSKLGINHFHLYFDSIHSNLDKHVEGKAYDLIQSLPYTTIYNMEEFGFTNEWHVLHHCFTTAHLLLQADWVMEFDIDEVFAFQERLGRNNTPPTCDDDDDKQKYGVALGALATFVANIPQNISAVIVPRINFRTNGIVFEPERSNQMELYVHRQQSVLQVGKVLVRTNTDVANNIDNKHSIWSPRDSVIYPCGKTVSSNECDESKGYCKYAFNGIQYPQEMHLSAAPFLYHYTTRSQNECELKTLDLPSDNWRVLNAAIVCAHTIKYQDMVYDYGLYCIGRAISLELNELYPSYKHSPFIF